MITLDTLELPYELLWTDEFSWSGVAAAAQYSLQGVQHIQRSVASSGQGRPITLSSPDAWITRADLETLYAMAADSETESFTLTLHDGRTFDVMFRHWDVPIIEATPIFKAAETDNEEYILSVKLVVV